jgi:hypothetical protein
MPSYRHPKPQPPTREMLNALERPSVRLWPSYPAHQWPSLPDPDAPLFDFSFKQPWLGVFTMPRQRFVLRVEHVPELMRLAQEFNKHRPSGEEAVGMSNIVTAALDFVLAHPLCLADVPRQEQIRERMAEAVYRRSFLRYLRHETR